MITTTTTLPAQVQQTADDILLSVRTPNLIMKLGAITKKLPSKGGRTLRMSRYDRLPTFPVPLGPSGATPPATPLNRVDIDATMSFYGQYVALNQQVQLQNQDDVINEAAELLGLSMRMTEDQLSAEMLMASATMYNAEGGANADTPTNIDISDVSTVVAGLMTNDAWMIMDGQEGELKLGTSPVRRAYLGLSHTAMTTEFNAMAGFINQWNYPNPSAAVQPSEWGSVENVRFFVSSVAPITPNGSAMGNTVYNNFIVGMESYCCVYQDNFTAQFLYRPPVYSDPLFQNVTAGAVFGEVSRLLNDLWITNLRSTLR